MSSRVTNLGLQKKKFRLHRMNNEIYSLLSPVINCFTCMKCKSLLIVFISILISSCGKDEMQPQGIEEEMMNQEEMTQEPTLEELREESINILASSDTKSWKIVKATLSLGDLQFDISNNFNVMDDVFVFEQIGSAGIVEWKKGHDIKTDVTNINETLLDKYVSSVKSEFNFQDTSITTIQADFGSCTFEILDENTVNAIINNDDGSIFKFTISEKTKLDYLSGPTTALKFSKAFDLYNENISCCAPGMIGSNSTNEIFLVSRVRVSDPNTITGELVQKFDLNNDAQENQIIFNKSDFVSKQLHIINNQLISLGGLNVNTYDLNLDENPTSMEHGKRLTRFGISVLDDDIYIIGGDIDTLENNKVFLWDIESESLQDFATLPEPKSGARGTIVDGYLYIFGGSEEFYGKNPTNKILKINISEPDQIEVFEMNKAIDFTFVQKQENLIYVAGQVILEFDEFNNPILNESTIGVFNTLDNTYRELETNLINEDDSDAIRQMIVLNNKMYILFGKIRYHSDNDNWNVLVSDLD